MRVLALIEALGQGDPGAWIDTLTEILGRAQQIGDHDTMLTLEAVRQAAGEAGLPYETRQALYEAAAERGRPTIARLFLLASPATVAQPVVDKQLAPERPLKPTGRPLTLGERKALARTHQREQLLLLIRDPHPAVVTILLDNPHVTEGDIVRIAAGRTTLPDSLSRIAAHVRWGVRHGVKRALVLNPRTPLAEAIRIATTLRPLELAEIAADPQLATPLRQHASDLHVAFPRPAEGGKRPGEER